MTDEINRKNKPKSVLKKIIKLVLIIAALAIIIASVFLYRYAFMPNINLDKAETTYVYIPTSSTYQDVLKILSENNILKNTKTFKWLAEQKNYPNHVYPGKYKIEHDMDNNSLINMLRSGEQQTINLIFTNIRTKEQLAGHIAKRIEADSVSIINMLNDNLVMKEYGLTSETAALLFIPNTYEFFWDSSAKQLLDRMHREYQNFWNTDRINKARELNFTPQQIGILASIVQQETIYPDEMDIIAGVYINRLKKGIPLQADPTIVYAHGDFTIKRVLKKHLESDSPYNTYKNRGLPPGPISIPTPTALDKVLNYKKHDYLYFCANDDFSGYHVFSRTYQQHLINARKYQKELNKQNIMK